MSKIILGLDLGTNSIGWSVIKYDFEKKAGEILGLGSRIIPMDKGTLDKFGSGQSHSQTADRTQHRSARKLYQRDNLRRERLHRVLNILNFLPEHYANSIDFDTRLGQFKAGTEVKLPYKTINGEAEFIFSTSYQEMCNEFKEVHAELFEKDRKIPYDWTLYYLRKKALTQKVSPQELAWIILNFNQKRGYFQLRGEEMQVKSDKKESYHSLKIIKVEKTDDKGKNGDWYNLYLEKNGWIYKRQSKEDLSSWKGKTREFIVTESIQKDGSIKPTFRSPQENDWTLVKTKTENQIKESKQEIGEYIYNELLKNPTQKIRGKLIKTIERKFYKEEFIRIIKTQTNFHKELEDRQLYEVCINNLYPFNESHRSNIKSKDFTYLFTEDIIFYQRPLKSKKSTISDCPYEYHKYTDKENKEVTKYLKVIPKSHPLFQEFRLWQFLKNLRIIQKESVVDDKVQVDIDVTQQLFTKESDWVTLFDWLNSKEIITQKQFLKFLADHSYIAKKEQENYCWNYVQDKEYPANETRATFINRLKKVSKLENPESFLSKEVEYDLWHIIYSVKDKNEFRQALKTFAKGKEGKRKAIDESSFFQAFEKIPAYKNEYGAYSEKAIKKLLPLMRMGKYWDESIIPFHQKERANNIIERLNTIDFNSKRLVEISDDDIPKGVLKSFCDTKDGNTLKGLGTHQACYLVYNRFAEANTITQWVTQKDIDNYLIAFKQHSLRNPIVEQVVLETLRVVRDIWEYYAKENNIPYHTAINKKTNEVEKHYQRFFNEIHIELGRDLKNPKDVRKRISDQNTENENTNNRVRELLKEFIGDSNIQGDIRSYSPMQHDKLKIYEEGVYHNSPAIYNGVAIDEIEKIRKSNSPTQGQITKYKLWLEQGYVSPYTGQPISLSRLFTTDYEIEHIIPQARYFDDSLSNKIICETEVNRQKSSKTAYEFLKAHGGESINLGANKMVRLLSLSAYEDHCKKYFGKNRAKLKKLLSEDVPEGFINRQINDTRYISKLVMSLLSNIVREKDELAYNSKHIVPINGAITDRLKKDWGMNDQWNKIIAPRFQRLNKLTNTEDFYFYDEKIKDFRCDVPDELKQGFSKKRIDHRHHAMDAVVIACATRNHLQYLSSLNNKKIKHELQEGLLRKNKKGEYTRNFLHPWQGFPVESREKLETCLVSFKQNLRVINKATNKTWKWVDEGGHLKKVLVSQEGNNHWAIRKQLHKDTVYGKVELLRERKTLSPINTAITDYKLIVDKKICHKIAKKVKEFNGDMVKVKKFFKQNPIQQNGEVLTKIKMYEIIEATAGRVQLSDKFTRKQLDSITDTGIQKILNNHVSNYLNEKGNEDFVKAFSQEGIEDLNNNITVLNDGKFHQPIYAVRIYEEGNKFNVGYSGNKDSKYVEAAKGTNLFFAIYWNEDKQKRVFETVPLNEVVEHQKQEALSSNPLKSAIPIKNDLGDFLFTLSPNDLVYIPSHEEIQNNARIDFSRLNTHQMKRIYKMVSSTGSECHFIPFYISNEIQKNEMGTNNKNERTQDFYDNECEYDEKGKPIMIKNHCWKITADRIGQIKEVKNHQLAV